MIYLVDGYNMLYDLGVVDGHEQPISTLVELLGSLEETYPQKKFFLYFDGAAPNYFDSHEVSEYACIRVQFSYDVSADDLLEHALSVMTPKHELMLVSNDRALQRFATRHDVQWMGIDGFSDFLAKRLG